MKITNLHDKLNKLREDAAEEGMDISSESISNFWKFIYETPHLSLTPDGNIYASWEKVSLVFYKGGGIKTIKRFSQGEENG